MRARLIALGLVVLAAALVAAAPASAARIRGTVVHQNKRGHSFVVADKQGRLKAIHARKRPRDGAVVKVNARQLRNGTFAAKSVKVTGHRRRARIHGKVTWVNRGAGTFTVSARGTSMLVRMRKHRLSKADATPSVGSDVTIDVTIGDNGDLEEQDMQETGQSNGSMDLEGVVLSVDTTANTITVSSDDNEQSGSGIVVHVPDASAFQPGQEVELVVTGPASDGSFTLDQSSLDGNQTEADSSGDSQDGGGDNGGGGGDNGGGD